MTPTHPFTDIEARLMAPPVTGIMLTNVVSGAPLAAAGVVAGDVIVRIDGADEPPDRAAFYQAVRKTADGPGTRRLRVVGDSGPREIEVALPVRGVSPCEVQAGVPAWDDAPDVGECDFSAFEGDVDVLLRNSLGEERAGHEVLRVRRRGDLIDVEVLFRLGGDDGQGGTWDYQTRGEGTLRLVPGLPAVRTAFWESARLVGDVRLEGGVWRGEKDGPDGSRVSIEHPAEAPVSTAYLLTLVPLTMPLQQGARLTFATTGDGVGLAEGRQRFECTGQETVKVDGAEVVAWCFVQRHYGLDSYGGDERFYVTDDRRLVRIDWGPNYGGCWAEAVPRERLNDGVPAAVHFVD